MRTLIPIYCNIPLFIHVADKISTIAKQYRLHVSDYTSACSFCRNNCLHIAITRKVELRTIAHESVHLANMVFQMSGVKPDLDNDEPQAYLVGFIFEKIMKAVKLKK